MSDRVVVLDIGRVIAEGPFGAVMADPEVRRAYLGQVRVSILELDGVSASYGPYRALDRVSFAVGAGEAVALVGPNGAGKSTVARVCAGLVVPSHRDGSWSAGPT